MVFPLSLDTGDVVLLYILYNLGTKKMEIEVENPSLNDETLRESGVLENSSREDYLM